MSDAFNTSSNNPDDSHLDGVSNSEKEPVSSFDTPAGESSAGQPSDEIDQALADLLAEEAEGADSASTEAEDASRADAGSRRVRRGRRATPHRAARRPHSTRAVDGSVDGRGDRPATRRPRFRDQRHPPGPGS